MTALSEPKVSTAIYVDFESLGNAQDRPAILGVLVVDHRSEQFRQFVLDDALRRAAVARKDVCVNATPDEAVTVVVEEAERRDLAVVSWSNYDREVVRTTCSKGLAARFCAVHRNALETAKPWKRHLYPNFPFALKRFGGKHPLKEYFRMTGYEVPAQLRPSAPAKWLKHTLQQIKANDGRYGHITQEAKRDWHKLLVYNEHDCRGMRAVIQQAAIELELWTAYEQTQFVVFDDRREVAIRAGCRNPKLDALLGRLDGTRWALLTAYNPDSIPVSKAENDQRQQQMIELIFAAGYSPLEGEGRDPQGLWPAEPSVLIPGIGRREAREIGRRFGQLTIVVGHRGFPARLISSGLKADRYRRA